MNRLNLPDGVAPDNSPKSSFSSDDERASGFNAPDMATPEFARSALRSTDANAHAHLVVQNQVEQTVEVEGAPIRLLPTGSMTVAIIVALALLLVGFATVIYAANNRQSQPLCSSQPEWNQYNCRAG